MTNPTPSVSDLLAKRAALDAELDTLMERHTQDANALFGRNLRRLRDAQGLTQQQLSDLTGIGRTSIANQEAGRQATSWASLLLMADALKVSLDEFRRADS